MYDLFNKDTLQNLAHTYGLAPSKRYGQNYLLNSEAIEAMIMAGELSATDTVVEIGPGFGVLTTALAPLVKKVAAFEIEKKLQPYWQSLAKQFPNLEITWGNALRLFSAEAVADGGEYKVIANVPYQITSPLIQMFLESRPTPKTIVCMVQKEVAERLAAAPGQMSVLGVITQYYAVPQIVAVVRRQSFWPEPKVDSAIIKLTPRPARCKTEADREWLFRVVKAGFSSPRKLLVKNLAAFFGKEKRATIEQKLLELGFTATVRAGELGVEAWMEIMNTLR